MMATQYTVLINAGNGRRLSDGVEQPTRAGVRPRPIPPAAQSGAAG